METFEIIYQNKIGKFSKVIKAVNMDWAKAEARWALPGGEDDAGYPQDTMVVSVNYCDAHARSREFIS